MPGMDGIEAADKIRALGTEYAKNIPIIALTANAIHGTEAMFYEHGFQAFITKPIDLTELDTVLRKWVRNESLEKAQDSSTLFSGESHSAASNARTKYKDMVITIQGVDAVRGLSYYGGETEIYLSILRSFTVNAPKILDKLRIVSRETLSDYAISVHGLKGANANIGAETMRQAAANLEAKSRAEDLDGVLAENNQFIKDMETLVANIKTWLEQHNAYTEKKVLLKAPDPELLAWLRQSCEEYNMSGIDNAISELDSADYETGADLITWIKEKIEISEISEVAARLAQYEEELKNGQ